MRNLLTLACLCLFASLAFAASQEEFGIAIYYDDAYHGRKTASQELYDKNKLTAAHNTLPFGTIIKVTRLSDNKSVKVRINDRGPFLKGRIVELSRKAAERLGMIEDGEAEVKIEQVGKGVVEEPKEDLAAASPSPPASSPQESTEEDEGINIEAPEAFNAERPTSTAPASTPRVAEEAPVEVEPPAPTPPVKKTNVKPDKIERKAKVTLVPPKEAAPPPAKALPEASMVRVKGADYKEYDLYKIQLLRPEKAGFGVQVASITNYENVLKRIAQLQGMWFKNILVSVEKGSDEKPVYKIILGPLSDRDTAESYKKQLKKKKGLDGFVVDLSGIDY
ncbi:MAG: septal ring lytic transglycosylase RlpA family protein [Bacteroidota bacterium]